MTAGPSPQGHSGYPECWLGRQAIVALPELIDVARAVPLYEQLLAAMPYCDNAVYG